jgi:hypothetical protein
VWLIEGWVWLWSDDMGVVLSHDYLRVVLFSFINQKKKKKKIKKQVECCKENIKKMNILIRCFVK